MIGAPLAIVRVIERVDTRQRVEEGDRWVPVPGSGVENYCPRCGRPHEVHLLVALADGTTALVGATCARRDNLLAVRAWERVDRARAALQRAERDLAEGEAEAATREAIRAELLPQIPPVTLEQGAWSDGKPYLEAVCGDHEGVVCNPALGLTEERRRCAVDGWIAKRMRERTGNAYMVAFLPDRRRAVARARARLQTIESEER